MAVAELNGREDRRRNGRDRRRQPWRINKDVSIGNLLVAIGMLATVLWSAHLFDLRVTVMEEIVERLEKAVATIESRQRRWQNP